MLTPLNNADGKSEATLLVEGLVEGMMQQYEAAREAFRVPLGVQEVTVDGLRKWFRQADPALRMQFIQKNGVYETLKMLSPGAMGGNGIGKEQR